MDYLAEIINLAVWQRRVENGLAKELELIFDEEIPQRLPTSGNTRLLVQTFTIRTRGRIEGLYKRFGSTEREATISIASRASSRALKAMAESAGKKAALDSISKDRLAEIFDGDAIEGRTVDEWRKRNKLRFHRNLSQQAQLGLSNNETLEEIQTRFTENVFKPQLRVEQALAKTAANNLSNAAIFEAAEASGLSRGYRLKVTLDGRTSKICLSYAATPATIYPYTSGSPRAPFHFRCRTILLPVIIGKEHQDIPPDGDKWFAGLKESTQNEILGKERAVLFRRGRIGLADLVRGDQTIATVPELRGVAAIFGVD
jgi:hypothetical protein